MNKNIVHYTTTTLVCRKKLKLVLPDQPLPIIDPNSNYLSYKIFWMEFNVLRNIYNLSWCNSFSIRFQSILNIISICQCQWKISWIFRPDLKCNFALFHYIKEKEWIHWWCPNYELLNWFISSMMMFPVPSK